eukprot:TRINITY_DN2652_c0_g1_i4.p1 TRINITY_DN2652_c0_g1~~TRINITY_DN2652_c0_g1_i4.p1  ORF type:complete len:402 (-),score=68.33 TRINITY_DN2652_c0_g1_i4:337-1542(-)
MWNLFRGKRSIQLKKRRFTHNHGVKQRRVAVTGLGLVTPLGTGVKNNWSRLVNSECGIENITHFDTTELNVKIAAMVPKGSGEGEFDPKQWLHKQEIGTTSPFMDYALCAAEQAIKDSGIEIKTEEDTHKIGVAIGSGIGSVKEVQDTCETMKSRGIRRISPYFIPKILINMAAGLVSIRYGLKGPNHSCSTACATGAHAIGDASRFIIFGDADVMIAGATEASIDLVSLAGFSRAKALATNFNDQPKKASRPFDKDRSGFVMGEGAGILVLEEYERAKKRGAHIYAEVKGYGMSGDAFHITSPSETGSGAIRAMESAIRQSGIPIPKIGYVNAHATSTLLGDRVENMAIEQVFGESAKDIAISSTKGAIGHLLGASGAVEAIYSILTLEHVCVLYFSFRL